MWPVTLLLEHAVVVGGVLLAAMSVVLALTQRRSPQSAAAWLISIVLVPYVAVPIFLLLGFRKQRANLPSIDFAKVGQATDAVPMAKVFRRLGAPSASGGNSFDLQARPDEAMDALEEVVKSATERLDILFYIVEPDASGRRFVELLTRKALDGVKVRVLLDRFGTLKRPRPELAALQAAGGEVRFCAPFLHPLNRAHMNLRNHRKMVVADNARVWSGGRNVGDRYLVAGGWTDLSFTAAGPVVQNFLDVFVNDWANADREVPETPVAATAATGGDAVLQLVAAGPDEPADALHSGLVQAIHAAQERVWIVTPYFVPTEVLAHALATAARRGIDVRLLVPERSNRRITDFARGAYLRELARAGGTVLQVPGPMVHAKMGVIDGAGWVGTANFDVRSMLLNFETALFAYDSGTAGALSGWFEAQAETAEDWPTDVWLGQRLLEGLFRLGSPIL